MFRSRYHFFGTRTQVQLTKTRTGSFFDIDALYGCSDQPNSTRFRPALTCFFVLPTTIFRADSPLCFCSACFSLSLFYLALFSVFCLSGSRSRILTFWRTCRSLSLSLFLVISRFLSLWHFIRAVLLLSHLQYFQYPVTITRRTVHSLSLFFIRLLVRRVIHFYLITHSLIHSFFHSFICLSSHLFCISVHFRACQSNAINHVFSFFSSIRSSVFHPSHLVSEHVDCEVCSTIANNGN